MKGTSSHVAVVVPFFGLVIAWALVAPSSDWSRPELVAALGGIAVVSFIWEGRLAGSANFLSAGIALALVALVIAGPAAALAVWLVPDLVERVVLRRRALITPGLVANVNGYGYAALAGAGVLALADPSSLAGEAATLLLAGLSMWVANFVWTELAYGLAFENGSAQALVRYEFFGVRRQMLAMLGLGVAAALLVAPLGLFALAILSVAVVLPQAALASLTSPRRVSRLERPVAAALYAAAIADVLQLRRRERRVLELAVRLPAAPRPEGLKGTCHQLAVTMAEVTVSLRPGADLAGCEARLLAGRANERFDGEDWPEGLAWLEAAPLSSRIVAVARAWSELTAAGTARLSHDDAICLLSSRAGTELDPAVIAAAGRVVADEQRFLPDGDFEPRLHTLPLPSGLRRGPVPAALARVASV